MVSCSIVVKVFPDARQGIAENARKIFESPHRANMGSSEANSDIKTYIEDVLTEKQDGGKLVIRNHELINEITDALVLEANGMLVCCTNSLVSVLTKAGSFGWLFKLKTYAARSVTVIFAKPFKNPQKICRRLTIVHQAHCQERSYLFLRPLQQLIQNPKHSSSP